METMEYLNFNCVHYLKNATSFLDMVYIAPNIKNSIAYSPPDLLHTFMCGLFKNVTLWVITIVINISKLKRQSYEFSQYIFDSRIASLKDICKICNVTMSYFRKGITFLSKNKSNKEKSYSTSGAGGLRSCEFVALVLQFFFAVGVDGVVLPITPNFEISSGNVTGNVTKIVLSCIITLLDAYFSIRMSPVTRRKLNFIETKINKMSKHFIILYQCMQKLCGVTQLDLPHSRKLHSVVCSVIPFMNYFGTMLKADTSSYESVHRVMTVGVWKKTSKRYDSMNEEMAKQSLLQNYFYTNELLNAIASNSIVNHVIKFGPYIAPSTVIITKINNHSSYSLHINDNDLLDCKSKPLHNILFGSSLSVDSFTQYCRSKLGEENWEMLKYNRNCSLKIIQGISIEGNEDTKLGKIMLYATNTFKNKRHRYSFISVMISDAHQPAQTLCFVQFSMLNETNDAHVYYYAIIRYLMPAIDVQQHIYNIITTIDSPFKLYEWEWSYTRKNGRRVKGPIIMDIIEVETIVSPAFVIPVFIDCTTIADCHLPSYTDRFWYADHKFFDRSDWDDIILQQEIDDNNEDNSTDYPDIYNASDNSRNLDMNNIDSNRVIIIAFIVTIRAIKFLHLI